MADDLSDLLPLFASEAHGRLERLTELLSAFAGDARAVQEMRRELHALKGASRMLGLRGFADVCHAVEDMLGDEPLPPRGDVEKALDALGQAVDEMESGSVPSVDAETVGHLGGAEGRSGADGAVVSTERAATTRAADELRVPAEVLGDMADRATHVRVTLQAFGALRARLGELAHQCECVEPVAGAPSEVRREEVASAVRSVAEELESLTRTVRAEIDRQLDELLMLQMQPLRPVQQKLARHARQLAQALGTRVTVELSGGETRLDRRVVDALSEALLHLVRNAVDHGVAGVETPQGADEPAPGRVTITAGSVGQRVTITVADDGPGIDPDLIADRAVELGIIDARRRGSLTGHEALQLLLVPGFTTRSEVTDVSGRGVGLDAVAAATQRIGGDLRIESTPGHGTAVTVDVPAMRRGERLVVVRSGQSRVGLPAGFVSGYHSLVGARAVEKDGRWFVRIGDGLAAFIPLARLIGSGGSSPGKVLIEGSTGGAPLAIGVDEVLTEEDVLIRPLQHSSSEIFEGMALLSNGRPVAVLSPSRIAQATGGVGAVADLRERTDDETVRILLVDDSMVTREMERRLLEDAGFEVIAVAEADSALRALSEHAVDCLVTDVEMPGMDGLELTRRIRRMPGRTALPVIVVSTRDRPEDRLAGLEAGADAYLVKQGLDPTELIGIIRRVGGGG